MTTRSKEEQAKLRAEMQEMVDELNELRDEAAEKVGDVPKSYKLNTWKDDMKFWLGFFGLALVGVMAVATFMWCLEHEVWLGIVAYIVVSFYAMLFVDAYRRRPYMVEEHVHDYWANDVHYNSAAKELKRLKEGIAEYDRLYEEKKEYIQKFEECIPEVGDFGSLILVLKASGFYALLKMRDALNEVNCRLEFDEGGHEILMSNIRFFNAA